MYPLDARTLTTTNTSNIQTADVTDGNDGNDPTGHRQISLSTSSTSIRQSEAHVCSTPGSNYSANK